jgi:hypothetical protein
MDVNDLQFNQLATVLNSINEQATGKSSIAPTNTGEFVSVANTLLKAGYDPVLSAITQVLSRTIFSIRPYTRKFGGLNVSEQRYGNHVRKLQSVDKPFEDDDRMKLEDGSSVDMYKVNKPEILQTNFYGANQYQKSMTIFRDQLDCAFNSPEEFGRFITMITQNASDMIEQAHENTARATLANFIGGKLEGDTTNVIHLVSEYNDVTGLALDSDTVKQPEHFVPFMKWALARIRTISDLMTERSMKYHINVVNKPVMRHTPLAKQKVYLYAPELNNIDTSVLSSVFHDDYLKVADHERVNFWQSIETPSGISVTPSYINPNNGNLVIGSEVVKSNILGVIFDEEAVGYTTVNQWSASTPFNARGGYSNVYYHFTDRYWNDFTENGVVLLLD